MIVSGGPSRGVIQEEPSYISESGPSIQGEGAQCLRRGAGRQARDGGEGDVGISKARNSGLRWGFRAARLGA